MDAFTLLWLKRPLGRTSRRPLVRIESLLPREYSKTGLEEWFGKLDQRLITWPKCRMEQEKW